MKRYEFESAVMQSNLDPQSKHILQYYAFRKNWEKDGFAFPALDTVARDTGQSLSTVNRRVPHLRANGWLIDTGNRAGRGVFVYDLAIGTNVSQTLLTSVTETSVVETEEEAQKATSVMQAPQKCQSDMNQCHSDSAAVSESHTNKEENKIAISLENMTGSASASPVLLESSTSDFNDSLLAVTLLENTPGPGAISKVDRAKIANRMRYTRCTREEAERYVLSPVDAEW